MKKILSILLVVGTLTFVACGPSAEEKAEKAKNDSIALVDSLNKVAAEKAKADSAFKADSIAKAAEAAKAEVAKPVKKSK